MEIIMKIEEKAVRILKEKNMHISFAESCTGGLAAARLVNVPDASAVFELGVIAYSNNAKTKLLDVPPELIKKHGAVSPQVAAAMAKGAVNLSGAEIGVGISGIAGPSGGTRTKPVGTVCFAIYIMGKVTTYQEFFGGLTRNEVREKSVDFVFERLVELTETLGSA